MGPVTEPLDLALRTTLLELARTPADPASADRMWEVLDDYDTWPGRRLVGRDGEHAAWIVVQLGDVDLQHRALPYLEAAVDCGDADPSHYACLLDRVRMSEGKPQVFGSQFVEAGDDGVTPWPIEDPLGVDERRRRFGLEPLAVQRRTMERRFRQRA
jgi:hypothetical protein